MPVTIGIARSRFLLTDNDGDGQADPGDVFQHTIIITNSGNISATSVVDAESENGLTIDPASVKIGPIAFDDGFNITGNAPITFTAAQLLGNDVDPDGPEASLVITGVSAGANGSIVDNGNGTYTFTPTTGLDIGQTATFTYTIQDAQGLSSVAATPGTVTLTVTDVVWFVDKDYAGANGAADGSLLRPFTDLASLNGAGGAGDVDSSNETIFIYDRTGTDVTANIILEAGQKLFGDAHAFVVNGTTVGASTSNSTIDHSGVGVTLASGNTIDGIDLTSASTTAIGIQDGGATVGSLTITNTNITGAGKIIDIDNGGTLAVTLGTLSSTGNTAAETGGAIELNNVGGNFTVTGPVTINGTQNQTGINIQSGLLTAAFQGLATANTGAQNAVVLNGTSTVSFTGGLDIDTTSGTGLTHALATLNVTGASNSINTTTGQIYTTGSGAAAGASGIAFATMAASGVVTGTAININNLDGNNFNGGNVTIAGTTGATSDGIFIGGGGTTNVSFSSATIDNTGDEGIEVNGAGNGTVTFTSVDIDGTTGNGVEINTSTGTVNINGGNIGSSNDPAADTVNITGGAGANTIAANLFKSSAGNIVDISGHSSGAISFSGNLSATGGASSGIALTNNTGGTITFSGASKVLNTGANTAISFTNTNATGATVNFQNGGLDIDTTTGTGINATSTTVGAGSLSITGTGNSATATTGRPVILDGVSSGGITFDRVDTNGGSNTAIFLKNAGTGGFTVTGSGTTNGSGGTLNFVAGGADLSTTQGVGVYLENVSNVSLSNMTFTGTFNNYGIRGEGVNNFTLRDSSLSAGATFGTTAAEGVIQFGTQSSTTGLTGTGLFEGNTIGNASGNNAAIYMYGANSLNLTFRDTAGGDAAVMNANNSTTGNDNLIVESGGTSNLTLSVTGVDFNGARGDQLQVIAAGSTTQSISVTGNSFDQSIVGALGGGVKFGGGGVNNYNVNYTFSNNTMTGSTVSAFDGLYNGLNGTITGVITGNTIGTVGSGYQSALAQTGSLQAFGIFAGIDKTVGGTVTYALRIDSNTIRDTADAGIVLRSNNGGNTGTARLEATITNNTVAEIKPTTSLGAMYLQIGGNSASGTDNALMGLNLTGNSLTAAVNNAIIFDQVSSAARFYLPGYGGSPNGEFANAFFPPAANGTASAGISSYLAGKGNTLTNGTSPSEPGGVNAEAVVGVTGTSFVLPVPILAAVMPGEDWETALQAWLSANTPTSEPDPVTSDPGSGDGTTNPVCDDVPTADKGGSAPVEDGILSQAELDVLVQAAIQRWADAGTTAEQLAAMRATSISVADMTGLYLGTSTAGQILVDSDGAGHGWFLDVTPGEDSEFEGSGSRLTADAGGPADGRMDLLTVLMHELGHQVGLADLYLDSQASELMYGYALMGERRLPQGDDLVTADLSGVPHGSFLLSPITIGVLPANKAVQVTYTSTVNSFSNQVIPNFNNTSTVTFAEAGSPVTSSQEALVIDSLSLGNLVFLDANNNGAFDAGDTGVNGVTISLFADADNNNVADGAAIATTTTAGGGLYSFTNLAPGNYIVSIDAANFTGGGALVGRSTATGGADPDDNVDNDDNGAAGPGGTVVSQSITLSYNNEPTPGTGNDTNNTLDFGFVTLNQAPVNTVPGAQSVNEDAPLTFSSGGGNAISIADADAGSGQLTVTLSVSHGALTLGGFVGLSFSNGDGTADPTFTFSGTLTNINNALAGLTYTPTGNYNGPDTLAVTTNDNGNTGADPGLTDGPNAEQDSDNIAITINSVNDPPSGADDSATIVVNGTYTFSAADFNFSDPVDGNAFAAVIVASLASNGGLFFDADGPGGAAPTAVVIGQVISAADLAAGKFTFVADAGETGTPYATFTFRVRDDGGTANGGNDTDPTPNTFTFNVTNDIAPVVDLNSGTGGLDDTNVYVEGGAASGIGSAISVTDADAGDNIESATITITDPEAGDQLIVNLPLPPGISVDGASTATTIILTGTASPSAYETALGQVGYLSSSDDPTDGGTNTNRVITVTVNDGVLNSAPATMTMTISPVDDAPVVKNDAFITDEATTIGSGLNLFNNNGSGADSDVDGPALSISAVNGSGAAVGTQIALASGALLTVNADGTFSYNPNGVFNSTPTPGSGAANQPAQDSFTYTLTGGGTATVALTINGLDSSDILFGTAGVDTLSSGAGVDVLNGLGGADTMIGGSGNDSYVVDTASDVVTESAGGGFDAIYSLVDYVLAEGTDVEGLSTISWEASTPINLTGNSLNNYLIGNEGSNALDGRAGDDALEGRGGNDSYVVDSLRDRIIELPGGGTFDAVYTSIDYRLANDTDVEGLAALVPTGTATINLWGNSLNNYIVGNAGTGAIDGGGGNDTMEGLGGNDFYVIDSAGDVVIEAASGGWDAAYTTVSYTLTTDSEIEGLGTLLPTATTAIDLTGNAIANYIVGNAGSNVIDGKAGNDALEGGAGADTYAFTTALGVGNVDTIFGFQPGIDKVALDDSVFVGLTPGALPASAFVIGTQAGDADDRIIYDAASGKLYFDADGNGAGAAVQFATVNGAPPLGASDFIII